MASAVIWFDRSIGGSASALRLRAEVFGRVVTVFAAVARHRRRDRVPFI
jgi:hypothetical protein